MQSIATCKSSEWVIMDKIINLNDLEALIENRPPNVWRQPPTSVEPKKFLSQWSVAKVVNLLPESRMHLGSFHLVGYEIRHEQGAVSSKILEFDAAKMQGITRSGRIYQLKGFPGHT